MPKVSSYCVSIVTFQMTWITRKNDGVLESASLPSGYNFHTSSHVTYILPYLSISESQTMEL